MLTSPGPVPNLVPSGKKAAKKFACRCIMHLPSTSGSALSPKAVAAIDPPDEYTAPSFVHIPSGPATSLNVSTTGWSLNGTSWATHLL